MFQGKTAWFSKSVDPKRIRLWKRHEGKVVSLEKAQFVFSDDSQCQDTKRLYESDAYINEHLALFHSSYVSACVKKEDMKSVVLGNYFLPPLEVMEVIRGQTKFAWEKHSSNSEESEGESDAERNNQRSRSGTTSSDASSRTETEAVLNDRTSGSRQTHQPSTLSNSMDVVHIDSLPKVTGVMDEFVPGENGCQVFLKS